MGIHNRYIPGHKFRPSASDVNAMLTAAAKVREGERPFPNVPVDPRSTTLCLVKNNTGATRSRFSVLGLDGPVIAPAVNLAEWKSRLAFKGILPVAGTHEGKYCVLLEPLKAGKIGTAAIAGVVPVRLTGAADSPWAEIANGVTTLAGGTSGSARVLWQESGASERWARVRIAEKAVAAASGGMKARKNSTGSTLGPRNRFNFIEGAGITLTVTDDTGDDEIDVTIANPITPYGCRITRSSPLTLNGTGGGPDNDSTGTGLQFDTELYDPNGLHSTSSNTEQILVGGGTSSEVRYWNCGAKLWFACTSNVPTADVLVGAKIVYRRHISAGASPVAQDVRWIHVDDLFNGFVTTVMTLSGDFVTEEDQAFGGLGYIHLVVHMFQPTSAECSLAVADMWAHRWL